MGLQCRDCVFEEVFLEAIEIDNMSSETLWFSSVLTKGNSAMSTLPGKLFPHSFPDIPT